MSGDHPEMSGLEDDPLGRPPVVIARAPHRTEMDAIRMILADEGVPSLVERDHEATPPDWTLQVSEAAGDDARRASGESGRHGVAHRLGCGGCGSPAG